MKRLLVAFLLLLVGHFANAAYLYFQVDQSDYAGSNMKVKDPELAVWVHAVNDSTGVDTKFEVYGQQGEDYEDGWADFGTFYIDLADVNGGLGHSFYIELVQYDEEYENATVVGRTEGTKSYSSLAGAGYIDPGSSISIPGAVWHGEPYVIPEPTSALLVMFGLGVLGLRRRRNLPRKKK